MKCPHIGRADACAPDCPGWAWFDGNDIQRCDSCDLFVNDDAVLEHIAECEACQAAVGKHVVAFMVENKTYGIMPLHYEIDCPHCGDTIEYEG